MRSRKFFATAATAAVLVVMGVVPAAAVDGTTTVTLTNQANTGALTITPTAAIATIATGATHTFTVGATTVLDTRGSASSVNLQLSVGNFGTGVLGSDDLSALTFGGCYDETTDVVVLGTVAAAAGADCAGPSYATLSGTATTIATVTNASGLSELTYTPQVQISDLTTVANDQYTFDITHTAI